MVNQTREHLSSLKVDAGNAQNMLENQETQKLGLIARSGELDREQKAIEERGQLIQHEMERLTNSSRTLADEIRREQESPGIRSRPKARFCRMRSIRPKPKSTSCDLSC